MVRIKAIEIDFDGFDFLIVPIGLDVLYRAELLFAKWTTGILNEPVKHALLMKDVKAAQHSARMLVLDAFQTDSALFG